MKIKIYIFMSEVKAHFLCTNSIYVIEIIIQVNYTDVACFHYSYALIIQKKLSVIIILWGWKLIPQSSAQCVVPLQHNFEEK
jgi:hypothetical protein